MKAGEESKGEDPWHTILKQEMELIQEEKAKKKQQQFQQEQQQEEVVRLQQEAEKQLQQETKAKEKELDKEFLSLGTEIDVWWTIQDQEKVDDDDDDDENMTVVEARWRRGTVGDVEASGFYSIKYDSDSDSVEENLIEEDNLDEPKVVWRRVME